MTWPVGVLAGVAACGVALVVQALVRKHLCGYKPSVYDRNCLPSLSKNCTIEKQDHEIGIDAQAPGKPTEKDGYTSPKKWNGEKVKSKKGSKYGWPDKKGNVWIPSGPNGHGGAHWDVQKPDGSYDNVLPGGKIRGK